MLKTYTYLVHPLDRLHDYIIMEALNYVCNAVPSDVFDITVFSAPLQDLINAEKGNEGDLLFKPLNTLFNIIKNEKLPVKNKLKKGLANNNSIEYLCSNSGVDPVLYNDLPAHIVKELKPFLTNLYEKLLNRAFVKNNYGSMKDHFNRLVSSNEMRVCPFCGINDLKSEFDDGRDAYDHYLPKGTFPFSSINFRNLVPMCNECNSGNKLEKVLIYEDVKKKAGRKKAFYPFAPGNEDIKISFSRKDKTKIPGDLEKITPEDIDASLECVFDEEVLSWNRVFGTGKRYTAKSCANVKMWIGSLLEEFRQFKTLMPAMLWDGFIETKLSILQQRRLEDKNLIKAPLYKFLKDECRLIEHLRSWENDSYKE